MTADAEAAETHLRLLAETQLRHSRHDEPGRQSAPLAKLRCAAGALAAVGVIDGSLADSIVSDLSAAMTLRPTGNPATRMRHLIHRSTPMVRSGAPWPGFAASPPPPPSPAGPPGQLQATSAGRMFRLHDEDGPANLWVLGVVRTPLSTWCCVATLMPGLSREIPYGPRVPRLRAVDDRGQSHSVHYTGYAGGDSGWLSIHPALADGTRWIELYSHLEMPRIRLNITGRPTPAQLRVDPAEPASPGERLLDAIALGMITHEPDPNTQRSLDEIVAALQAAHALPPGSLAPGRLAAVCQRALLDIGPGLVAALESGTLPAVGLPEPWTSVLAQSLRRHRPTVKDGVAPLAVALPELDGIQFVLAGLRSGADHSLLSVVAQGLPPDDRGDLLGVKWSQWFPWWIRDSAGHWHAAWAGDHNPDGGELTPLQLRVYPPLPRSVSRLDVIITGRSARITVCVPVEWVTGP